MVKQPQQPYEDALQLEEQDPQLSALLAKLKKFHPNADQALVEKAYNFASHAHAGQKRK